MNIRYFPKRGTLWLDFRDAAGTRHRVPTGATTQAQAELVAPQVIANRLNKPLSGATVPEVGLVRQRTLQVTKTLREAFKLACSTRGKWIQAKDMAAKESDFAGLLMTTGLTEDSDCSVLTREFMQKARAEWLKQPGKRRDSTLSASSINHRLSMASVLLETVDLPPHTVRFLSVKGNRRKRRVREEELQAMVSWCLANHTRAGATTMADLILVGLHTTCRMGELLPLRWADVYLDRGTFIVRDPKNDDSREAVMDEVTERILKARQDLGGDGPFIGLGKWQATALWNSGKAAMGLADDHEFVFHVATRHEGLSRHGDSGQSAYMIMEIGGHKSIAASSRYVKPARNAVREAMNALSRVSNASTKGTDAELV